MAPKTPIKMMLPDLADELVRECTDAFYNGLAWARPVVCALFRITVTNWANNPKAAPELRARLEKANRLRGRPESAFLIRKGLNELLDKVVRGKSCTPEERLAAAAALLALNKPSPTPVLRDTVSNHQVFTRQANAVVKGVLALDVANPQAKADFEAAAALSCDDVQAKSMFFEKLERISQGIAPTARRLAEMEGEAGLELDNLASRKKSPLLRLAARLLRSIFMDPRYGIFGHLRDALTPRAHGGVVERLMVASILRDSRKGMDADEWRRAAAICLLLATEIPGDLDAHWHRMFEDLEADSALPNEFRDLARSYAVEAVAPFTPEQLRTFADLAEGRAPESASDGPAADAPRVPAPKPSRRASGKRQRLVLEHAGNYSWIRVKGKLETLTGLQAQVIRYLHQRVKDGVPEVSESEVLRQTSSQSDKLRELFKANSRSLSLYSTLIKRLGRGIVRLKYR